MEVSIVIVCMNRPDYLYPCLESIRAHTSVSYEVWVVAYRFSPENMAALRADWPSVRIVENNALSGFSENNNLALRQVQGRYCFIVNDDTLKNPGFIGIDDIVNTYLPHGFSNFKIEGRGLGSAVNLEFLLYYLTKPEYQLTVREEIYLDSMLDLF